MRIRLVLNLILISVLVKAQEIKHYKGKIFLDSLKVLNADFKIHYSNTDKKECYFYINKNTEIRNLTIDNHAVNYSTENATDYMPDFKKIIIKDNLQNKFDLEIIYSYRLDKVENRSFLYNPNWIELSLYTAWFPVNLNDKNYSYQLEFKTPENYQIISPGILQKNKNKTIITNKENYQDIPVVLSDQFQLFSAKNKKINFYGIQLSNEQIEDIQNTADHIYNFFKMSFGENDSNNLIVAVNPFAHPMSYARKGFISLSLQNGFSNSDKITLAHEIGHLWWQNAPHGTYEDWLNESFAEFSALQWMQEKLSKTAFDELLKKYEKAYQKPIKISQTLPNENNWYSIAYLKNPYILYRLEQKIGKEKMFLFLKATYQKKISNTKNLIELLKKYADENIVKEFESEIY
nr:hypothetical protein [Flavobacterium sp. ASV13]